MARWGDEGRWEGQDDRWQGRRAGDRRSAGEQRGERRRFVPPGAPGPDWRGTGDWRGVGSRTGVWRGGEQRGREWRGEADEGRDYRTGGGEQGGREEWERGGAWRGAGPPNEERGNAPYRLGDDYGAREYGSADFERRPESGDYTTYGQTGYRGDPGRGMHEDIRYEQGPGGIRHEHDRWMAREHARGEGPLERFGERVKEGMRKLTGRGPKGYRRSDDRIREEVCETIARSGVNAEDVEVRVENCEVTLTGNVDARADKRMLEDLAEDVFGVEEVHDHVRVNRGLREPQGETASMGPTVTGQGRSAQRSEQPQTMRPPPSARH